MKNSAPTVVVKGEAISLPSGRVAALVACSGVYGIGSSGKPDAAAINAEIKRLLVETASEAVLLDYSALDYRWGDDIWLTLQPDDPRDRKRIIPVAVVPGEKSQEALKSLLEVDGGFDSWLESGFVFFTLAEAASYLAEQVAAAQPAVQRDGPAGGGSAR